MLGVVLRGFVFEFWLVFVVVLVCWGCYLVFFVLLVLVVGDLGCVCVVCCRVVSWMFVVGVVFLVCYWVGWGLVGWWCV